MNLKAAAKVGLLAVVGAAAVLWLVASRGSRDTENVLYPEPVERTAFRARTLSIVIGEFYATRHRLPETMTEIIAAGASPMLTQDAWGRPLLYRREGSSFVIQSVGPDGVPTTADDITIRRTAPDFTEPRH